MHKDSLFRANLLEKAAMSLSECEYFGEFFAE